MATNGETDRLSQLETSWTQVIHAHTTGDERMDALAQLLPRYCRAIRRYLLKVVGNETAVEEICQEFAYRFVRGDFRHAQPSRGRFRDYVKAAVLHLACDYRQREQRIRPLAGTVDLADESESRREAELVAIWRQELLNRTWEGLARHQDATGGCGYTVLRLRADEPQLRSAEMAARLNAVGGQHTQASIRQTLHRAREKFAELLLGEVQQSIPSNDPTRVADELAELQLLEFCKPTLTRQNG